MGKMSGIGPSVLCACALFTVGGPAFTQSRSEAELYAELFKPGRTEYASLFDGSFLAQVPEPQIVQIVRQYVSALGEYRNAVGASGTYDLIFERGKAPSRIAVNAEGKIAGLWFGLWTLFDDSPEKLLSEFRALEGTVSLCVVKNGTETVLELSPDVPLAVGSAFKLYILEALSQRIGRGDARWTDVIALRREWSSLPSGFLQEWPEGSPVTLHTLASLMISQSDNTATDHLLFHLGREAVEAVAPERVRPFISTMELFKLKWGSNEAEQRAFLEASVAEKQRILSDLAKVPSSRVQFTPSPVLVGRIGWQITARELCGVIYGLRDNPVIAINPGLADKRSWSLAGFKGGSEPGVLNYTHVLRKNASSPVYSVAATINHTEKAVNAQVFTELVTRLIGLIERGAL